MLRMSSLGFSFASPPIVSGIHSRTYSRGDREDHEASRGISPPPVGQFDEGASSLLSLIRDSVAGNPLIFKKQSHNFDPEAGARWREEFERLHGPRGAYLIAKQGEGVVLSFLLAVHAADGILSPKAPNFQYFER
ncbi:hypothetical protein J437_LFUL005988 [Ladona fulva]|uniref:Uncharacterized protein n=1 Tax=Ladona fulva TaxID=123851 RepID=A0A8K0NVC5_LADFU|nr:hypothetical protein J437_LFUL005988 [Ladona fulva]